MLALYDIEVKGVLPMGKKMHRLLTIFFTALLVLGLTGTASAETKTVQEYITEGETAFFSKTVDGILEAHSIFEEAQAAYPSDPVINAYLALTRLFDLALTEDAGGLTDLLAQYGVSRAGYDLDTLEFEPHIYTEYHEYWEEEKLMLPNTAPSGETIRSFLAGPLLNALNDSIANLDTTITDWSIDPDTKKHIIDNSLIGSETDPDIEFDYGDALLFRAGLKAAKSLVLIISAYDLDVSVRELVAFGNLDYDLFHPNEFLDRYPDFLKLLPTTTTPSGNGVSQLSEARTALMGAIDDYLAASDAIRNDPGTEYGAEELIALEDCDLLHEEFIRNRLVKIKNNLTDPLKPVIEFVDREETWIFTDYVTEDRLEVHFWGNMSEGNYSGLDGCDFVGCGGWFDCIMIEGDQITIEVEGVTFTGTLNTEKTEITEGTYTGRISGTFTAIRDPVVEEKITRIDLNPFFGTGTSPNTGPYNVRDFLPQFNECGNPIAGTAGHGLGDDATLGGILPDFTQNDWKLDGALCGTVNIAEPTTPIVIDGALTDWSGISPVFTDIAGNNDPDLPGTDINQLYLAKDNEYLYLAMTLHDGAPSQDVRYAFVAANQGCGYDGWGELRALAYHDGEAWVAEVIHSGDWEIIGGPYLGYAFPGNATGDPIEWKVPLTDMGNLSGRYIRVYTQGRDWYDASEDHATCLQIQPVTEITVTLNVPAHDGEGAIYIGVFQYNVDYKADPDYFISGKIIYPAEYSAGMTYTVPDVPENEKVFVGVWWDADLNGVQTTGDYVGNTDMVTTGSTPTTVDLYADEFYLLDTDGDQMDDIWEIDHFGDTASHDGTADGDADNLTDLQEYNNRTNPNNADSDSDGMSDGWEVSYGFDPLTDDASEDLDSDGLSNVGEYQNSTNPTLSDSDGDLYSDGEEVANGTDPNNIEDKPQYSFGEYYAAPDNPLWGDGTQGNPWNLHTAIHHINEGSAGDYALHVASGTYQVTGETEPNEELILTQDNVTIIGETGEGMPVLDGTNAITWIIGIEITADYVTIKNIAVKGFADWGIKLYSGAGNIIEGCEIYDNGVAEEGGGIYVYNCSPDIRNNNVYNNYPAGILIEGDGADASPHIERNEIHANNIGIGVNSNGSGGYAVPMITNNLIYDIGSTTYYIECGIGVSAQSGGTASPFIYHNTIDEGASDGICILNYSGTTTPDIKYNIITNFSGYGIYNSLGNPIIYYNDVYGNTADQYGGDTADQTGTNGNISGDPLYTSYELQESSPCIDKITTDSVTIDFAGYARPKGEGYDMGAYEFIADIAHDFDLPGGTGDPTDYRMFTVPVELHTGAALKNAMEDALGPYDKGIWRVFAWDPGTASYIELDDPAFADLMVYPGRGFWVISTLTDTITFSGKPAPDGGYLDIPLSPGWNMIAVLWSGTPITIDKIAVSDGITNYWITSTNNTFTQQYMWDYTGSGPYEGYEQLTTGYALQPGKAYWIKVPGTAEIIMLVPKDEEGGYFSASSVKTALKASAMVEDIELPPPPPGVSGGGTTIMESTGCFIGTVAPME